MGNMCGNCFQEYDTPYGICPHCGYDNRSERPGSNCLEQGFLLEGRYLIGRVLGAGGFGITYLAYDMTLRQIIALKEYLPGEFSTRVPTQAQVTVYTGEKQEQFIAGRKRFVEEARKLAKFQNHEGILHVYDCFDANNTSYIVMEYLEGKTVSQMMHDNGKIEPDMAIKIICDILLPLEDIHKSGILHRDIAPDNIMVLSDGRAKLIDFGAARYATTSHSKSLSILVKQGYTPAEQYQSKGNQGPWTDVYSSAATLYAMLTGRIPQDAMERMNQDELVKPSKLGAKVSKSVDNAIMNALNIPVEGRYQSAREFREALMSATVKRRKAKMKQADIGKLPIGIKIGISAAVVTLIVVSGMIFSGKFNQSVMAWGGHDLPEGQTRVPNVVNFETEEAQSMVESSELKFQISDKEYSDAIPKGKILSQSLSAGEIVEVDTLQTVVVSGGTKRDEKIDNLAEDEVLMPDVQYKDEQEAINTLQDAGLDYEIFYEQNDTVAEGKVISQDQTEEEAVKKNTKVKLTVSKKEEQEEQRPASNNTPTTNSTPAGAVDVTPTTPVQPTPETPAPETQAPAADNGGWQGDFDLAF